MVLINRECFGVFVQGGMPEILADAIMARDPKMRPDTCSRMAMEIMAVAFRDKGFVQRFLLADLGERYTRYLVDVLAYQSGQDYAEDHVINTLDNLANMLQAEAGDTAHFRILPAKTGNVLLQVLFDYDGDPGNYDIYASALSGLLQWFAGVEMRRQSADKYGPLAKLLVKYANNRAYMDGSQSTVQLKRRQLRVQQESDQRLYLGNLSLAIMRNPAGLSVTLFNLVIVLSSDVKFQQELRLEGGRELINEVNAFSGNGYNQYNRALPDGGADADGLYPRAGPAEGEAKPGDGGARANTQADAALDANLQ